MVKIIEQSYADGKTVDREALEQLQWLGEDASETLPLLQRILEQLKRDGNADFREIESLEYAIAAVKGEPSWATHQTQVASVKGKVCRWRTRLISFQGPTIFR